MLRILIVEDEFLVGEYLTDLIEVAGHSVVAVAATGENAVGYLRAGGIDLAVLDINLKGGMSGIDVANAAQAYSVPHVYVTGSGDPVTRMAAEVTGPQAFIQKPVDSAKFYAVLAALTKTAG